MIFNITIYDLINILLIAGGMGVCGLCFLHISSSFHLRKEVRMYFQIFFTLIALYIASHLVRELMNGLPGEGARTTLYVVTFIELLFAGFMAHMMSMLLLVASKAQKGFKIGGVILFVLFCVHVALLTVGRFFDLIYYFDEFNVYHRGAYYILSNVAPILMLVMDVIILIRYRRNMDKLVYAAFWAYILAPVAAIIIQAFFYELQFIIFATVGAAVFMFAVIVRNQNAQYEKQQVENSRIETELTMASSIQADMLPNIYPAFPERPEFDIFATMEPAKEVGGDFYDFFLVDDDHLCMVMADVSGKGVPAALFMMASKIILANNAKMNKTPAQILTDTNASICANNREEMFVTVWLGILEISTGKLTAANAGHEYPVVRKPNGEFELLKDKHGFVIGGMDGAKYKEYELNLEPGSRIFLYTDGVPEATNAEGKMFGVERMLEALNSDKEASVEQTLKNVRDSVDSFVKDATQFDDLTMLCAEYLGTVENN